MSKLKEMIRRKKDQGFTLIELMIVIAVIGILAIVLVPKVGTVKTQAKSAGLDTNVRMVQGYIQSRISSWNNAKDLTNASVAADIKNALDYGNDKVTNPFVPTKAGAKSGDKTVVPSDAAVFVVTDGDGADAAAGTASAGIVVVSPVVDTSNDNVTSVKIYVRDVEGNTMKDKTITITP